MHAAPMRQGWLFERLATAPAPSYHGVSRHQLIGDAVSYADLAMLRAGAMVDFGLIEARVSVFRSVSTRAAKLVSGDGLGSDTAFQAEVARYSITPSAQYGRLALEVLRTEAGGPMWISVRMNAGTLETAAIPWKLGTLLYLSTASGGGNVAVVGVDISRLATEGDVGSLRIGANLRWVYWLKIQPGINPNENMLFSFGPALTWNGAFGSFELSSPLRVWIDKETIVGKGTASPSEFTAPAVNLSATFGF